MLSEALCQCYHTRRHSGQRGKDGLSRLSVCLFVCALTEKRLELTTPNLVHVYSIAVAQHALTQRSKGQRSRSQGYENRHGARLLVACTTYSCAVLPAAVADVGLHVDTTACFLVIIIIIIIIICVYFGP